MKTVFKPLYILFYQILSFLFISLHVGIASEPYASYKDFHDEFIKLKADPSKIAEVKNLEITRDAGTFILEEGKLYLCSPISNRICAAFFSGTGRFKFSAPTLIEQEQLKRFYDKDSLNEEFFFMFIVFADSTVTELQKKISFTAGKIPSDVQKNIEYSLKYMGDRKGVDLEPMFILPFVEGTTNDLFFAEFGKDKLKPMFFQNNPYMVEEIQFSRRNLDDATGFSKEIINQFHKKSDYIRRVDPAFENKDLIQVDDYDIKTKFEKNLELVTHATLNVLTLQPNRSWFFFNLSRRLFVDSVVSSPRHVVSYTKLEESPNIWIHIDSALSEGENITFEIYYHGDLLVEFHEYFYIRDDFDWYPLYYTYQSPPTHSIFNLEFTYPEKYQLLCIGERTVFSTQQGMTTAKWESKIPVRNASFTMGYFKESKLTDNQNNPISVYMTAARGDIDKVSFDIISSINFFQTLYGKRIYSSLNAVEIPYSMGVSYPGMINLWSGTFDENTFLIGSSNIQERLEAGEIMRAHEVAHQWWGTGMDFSSYHDQWLSEGFAHYSALLYMHYIFKEKDKLLFTLSQWKDVIMASRNFIFGNGQEAGPIWLGYRTQSSQTRRDYDLIIYKKGAWVLHMLRMMLIDPQTNKENEFMALMQDFYENFKGKKASTKDFQEIVTKHFGMDMNWFFNEWVYGSSIPSYKFSYTTSPADSGQYKVSCKVLQDNVPDNFQMVVPIYVDFGESKGARLRVVITGKESKFELPLFKYQPKKITFNSQDAVLCEVENVKWKDE